MEIRDRIRQMIRFFLLLSVFLSMFFPGCSFPRVIVLKDPLTPEEHLNLGVAYEKRGELDLAITEYRKAAKKLPMAYFYLGNTYFEKKDWLEAERNYKKAIKKDSQNADAYNNLAWLYYTKGERLVEAEALALKAIELNPAKVPTYRDTLEKVKQKLREE
jgi:tetratricopeptide (TPR) repeat protein